MSNWLIVIVSLFFSAFFSGMEIAFINANKLKIEVDKSKGSYSARLVSRLNRGPSNFIGALLLGNNIALVIYGMAMVEILKPAIESVAPSASEFIILLMALLEIRIQNLLKTRRLLKEKFRRDIFKLDYKLPANTEEQNFIELAYTTVEQGCGNSDFRPEDFAAAMNMSMRSLQRKLKTMADLSPFKFINEVRMAKAAKLLAGTELTITEIAFEVGCEDTSNFTKLFKQQFNRTPSDYRSAPRNQ